ncbi:MAG: hypothetical protein ABL855_07800 [Sideroxydans sp.]
MPDSYMQCPKCGHKSAQPLPSDTPCPACGIYPFKWGKAFKRVSNTPVWADDVEGEERVWGIQCLLQPLPEISSMSFGGRVFAWIFLSYWSFSLIGADYRDGEIFGSFMHNILLPIHEAGHVLFMPFGEFLTIFGGSLFQLALPFGIAVAFVVKNRDNFSAAIVMWWTSISLLDLSPYIYDARHPQLIMLGGHTGEDGPHDWIYLLNTIGQIQNSPQWGSICHGLGSVLAVLALLGAALILLQQHRRLKSTLAL